MELEPMSKPTRTFFCPPPNIFETPLGIPATCRNQAFELSDSTYSISGQTYNLLAAVDQIRHFIACGFRRLARALQEITTFCMLPLFVIRSECPDRSPITPAVFLAKTPSFRFRGKTRLHCESRIRDQQCQANGFACCCEEYGLTT